MGIIGGYSKFWFSKIYYNLIIAMFFDVVLPVCHLPRILIIFFCLKKYFPTPKLLYKAASADIKEHSNNKIPGEFLGHSKFDADSKIYTSAPNSCTESTHIYYPYNMPI